MRITIGHCERKLIPIRQVYLLLQSCRVKRIMQKVKVTIQQIIMANRQHARRWIPFQIDDSILDKAKVIRAQMMPVLDIAVDLIRRTEYDRPS